VYALCTPCAYSSDINVISSPLLMLFKWWQWLDVETDCKVTISRIIRDKFLPQQCALKRWKSVGSSLWPSSRGIVSFETSMKQAKSKLYLATHFIVFFGLTYSSTLKIKKIFLTEMLVGFQWTALRYIPEDRTLQLFLMLFELRSTKCFYKMLC
jgi:hypothetical protein